MKVSTSIVISSVLGFLSSYVQASILGDVQGQTRKLKAANRQNDLLLSDHGIHKKNSLDMVFSERDNWDLHPVLFSRVRGASDSVFLNIEEFEQNLDSVRCLEDATAITLQFRTESGFEAAKNEINDFQEGVAVTSHGGCNGEGERKPYKIKSISINSDEREIRLLVQPQTWKETFKSVDVEFGFSRDRHTLRSSSKLDRRASPAWSQWGSSELSRRGSNSSTSNWISLNHGLINKPINFPGIPIPTTCLNCSTFGMMEVITGSLHVDFDVSPPVKGAWVDFNFTGLGAIVELQNQLTVNHQFDFPLPTIPIVGFSVPLIGNVGLTLQPTLVVGVTVQAPVTISYGMEATVPDGSNLLLDFFHPEHCHMVGFDDTDFNPIPFQFDAAPGKLGLSAGFQPKLQIGFEVLEVEVEAGAFVDLPKMKVTLEQLTNVDATCSPLPNTTSLMSPSEQFEDDLFGDLTSIETDVILDVGVFGELGLPIPFPDQDASTTLFKTSTQIATACLSWDDQQASFTPATQVLHKAIMSSKLAAAAEATSAGAAGHINAPTLYRSRSSNLIEDMIMALVFVAGFFVAV